MYCSTCGAVIPRARGACSECGTPVTAAVASYGGPETRASGGHAHWPTDVRVATCPRCGYEGMGISYFSRGSHLALLIGLGVITMGMMGAGGLIYYFLRHEYRLCPRCALNWGKPGEFRVATRRRKGMAPGDTEQPLPIPRESSARTWSVLLAVVAALLVVAGLAGGEVAALVLGLGAGGGAWLLNRSARAEREARRAALLSSLQLPVLRLARERHGRLTVTEVATEFGWTMPRAEKVLESLNDGYRVSSDVTDEGVIVYEFLELMEPRQSLPGTGG